MALKIDRQEGSLSSLDEMRVKVIFQLSSGSIIGSNADSSGNDKALVADSIGDLPSVGDYVVLNDSGSSSTSAPTKNSYKIISRSIDFGDFSDGDGRIICTLRVEIATV